MQIVFLKLLFVKITQSNKLWKVMIIYSKEQLIFKMCFEIRQQSGPSF